MQDIIYLFPFESVEKGSNIIIYGAGNVGQSFLEQIRMTNYCNVVAVADRAYDKYPYLGKVMILPEQINDFDYDRIVIAVDGDTRYIAMKEVLLSQGIDEELIVSGSTRAIDYSTTVIGDASASDIDYAYKEKEGISIAFFLAGGLGDCIIDKKFINALLETAKASLYVDLYGDMYNEESINSFFRECSYVKNRITGKKFYQMNQQHYDLAISVLSFAIIDTFHEDEIKEKDEKFCLKIKELQGAIKDYELVGNRLGEAGIHFERMKYRGENCFTFFSYGGVLDINDMGVSLSIEPTCEEMYISLGLPDKYITVNYGWGNNIHGEYKVPNKVWPFEYYESLVTMIKELFPNLYIVQTGTNGSPKIPNVDKYVFSVGLDTLEYVLRDSTLHIDCESGLVHLATQLGTKCVVVFGPTLPEVFGYPQNINILSERCSGCRALMDDFSRCLHKNEDRECMYSIKPERVFNSIREELVD